MDKITALEQNVKVEVNKGLFEEAYTDLNSGMASYSKAQKEELKKELIADNLLPRLTVGYLEAELKSNPNFQTGILNTIPELDLDTESGSTCHLEKEGIFQRILNFVLPSPNSFVLRDLTQPEVMDCPLTKALRLSTQVKLPWTD